MGGRGTLGIGGIVRLALVLVIAGVLWGVGAAIAGYHVNRSVQDRTCGAREMKVAFLVRMYKTEPCGPDGATGVTAPVSAPCTVYVAGHDAQVAFSGPTAGQDCARLVLDDPGNAGWTRDPQTAATATTGVCSLMSAGGQDTVSVIDSGSTIYGTDACNALTAEGWKPAS
jgi:hypothetical protein